MSNGDYYAIPTMTTFHMNAIKCVLTEVLQKYT